jgi:DNA-directed RNA polymerase subunit F
MNMMNEKVLSVNPIPLVKVKEILKGLSKEGELTYEQNLTLKYAEKFAKLPRTKAEKLMEELMKIEGMTNALAIKLVDLLPQSEEVLSLVIGKQAKISDENQRKILELIKGHYTKEKKKKK